VEYIILLTVSKS